MSSDQSIHTLVATHCDGIIERIDAMIAELERIPGGDNFAGTAKKARNDFGVIRGIALFNARKERERRESSARHDAAYAAYKAEYDRIQAEEGRKRS